MEPKTVEQQLQAMRSEIAQLKRAARPPARKTTSRTARIALVVATLLIPVVAFGVTITKPHTFVSGQPISASELNENFDTVYDRVNELGVYKVKAGSTVLGSLMGVAFGTNSVTFLTDEGYLSGVYEANSTTTTVSFIATNLTRYYTASDCSGNPILPLYNKKIVVYDIYSSQLLYTTNTHPATVPGYVNWGGICNVNGQAGNQLAADFWTTAVNNETITGVPDTVSGAITISLE